MDISRVLADHGFGGGINKGKFVRCDKLSLNGPLYSKAFEVAEVVFISVYPDGSYSFCENAGKKLYLYDKDHNLKWTTTLPSNTWQTEYIERDGYIYLDADNYTSQLGRVNKATGVYETLFTMAHNTGQAIPLADGVMVWKEAGNPNTISKYSYAGALISSVSTGTGSTMDYNGFNHVVDEENQCVYYIDASYNLYKIDFAVTARTLILGGGIARTLTMDSGFLYVGTSTDLIKKIDKATKAEVWSVAGRRNVFHMPDGKLYALDAGSSKQIHEVNKSTGALTLVGTFQSEVNPGPSSGWHKSHVINPKWGRLFYYGGSGGLAWTAATYAVGVFDIFFKVK